jgi:hypothetical protein
VNVAQTQPDALLSRWHSLWAGLQPARIQQQRTKGWGGEHGET